MNFTINRGTPSATCDCGHLACFHVKDEESPREKHEVENLRQRLEVLEEQLDADRDGSLAFLISQIRTLSEGPNKDEEDQSQEIRNIYRNLSRMWQSIQQLEARAATLTRATDVYNSYSSLPEARPAGLTYRSDERVGMQGTSGNIGTTGRRYTPNPIQHEKDPKTTGLVALSPTPAHHRHRVLTTPRIDASLPLPIASARTQSAGSPTTPTHLLPPTTVEPWTVHISFLPDASQPFPFERDTIAYRRCLSRGLHRMVVVSGPDADAFTSIILKTFGHFLQGWPWMPLQAKLCAAEKLSGLPMLRPLDPKLQSSRFDHEFLQNHCAVCDPRGKIESLYLAPRSGALSWELLRDAPVYIGGLEASWKFDPALDQPGPFHKDSFDNSSQPWSVDDVTNTASKRTAAEISPTPGPGGSSAPEDGEGSRKLQRTARSNGLLDLQLRMGRV